MSPAEEEIKRLTKQYLDQIGEYADAAQVLVSWNEEGNTNLYPVGVGNWYARQGMAHDFINADQSQTAAREVAEALRTEDEE